MSLRIAKIICLVLLAFCISCREPQRADLKSFLPAGTLIYLEASDLSKVGGVFTENKDWRALSDGSDSYLSYLKNKQAALAVIGFQNNDRGTALQVRPELALVIDTQSSGSQAVFTAEKILRELSRRFSGQDAGVEKQEIENAQWMTAPGSDGQKIYATVSGQVVLIANSENALRQCLDVRQGKAANLLNNSEFAQAGDQDGAADQIAFGYVSSAGIKELSNYLAVSYALKTSENTLIREMISGILPEMTQKTVTSVTWSARATSAGVEDTYFIKTDKEFAGTIFQTVKASAANDQCDSKYIPQDIFSTTCYRLEDPQLAWRGALLSLAKQLDPKALGAFQLFSGQLLKPYGIDDPELFLSAAGPQIATARFDADANIAAAIVKIKDKAKLKQAMSETFDFRAAPDTKNDVEFWKSRDGEFAAAFAGDDLIIGNSEGVMECLRAAKTENISAPEIPTTFSAPGAIFVTRQKDDSAIQILSEMAAQRGRSVDVKSYAFVETRIEARGIKRRALSAFGLFGEIFRQAIE
jgi:hypothetical protein